jgi:hypothetical protein
MNGFHWKSSQDVQPGFWDNIDNQKKFLDKLSKEIGYTTSRLELVC